VDDAKAKIAWLEIAADAYRAYSVSTGNKNFRGEPMPAWADLPESIQAAWAAAVFQVNDALATALVNAVAERDRLLAALKLGVFELRSADKLIGVLLGQFNASYPLQPIIEQLDAAIAKADFS
jgi:hypothetical protein